MVHAGIPFCPRPWACAWRYPSSHTCCPHWKSLSSCSESSPAKHQYTVLYRSIKQNNTTGSLKDRNNDSIARKVPIKPHGSALSGQDTWGTAWKFIVNTQIIYTVLKVLIISVNHCLFYYILVLISILYCIIYLDPLGQQ